MTCEEKLKLLLNEYEQLNRKLTGIQKTTTELKNKLGSLLSKVNEQTLFEIEEKKTKPKSIYSLDFRSTFEEYYYDKKGVKFHWTAKSGGAILLIIKTIQKSIGGKTNKEFEQDYDDVVLNVWKFLLDGLENYNKFVFDNLTPEMIYSNLNKIFAKARKNKNLTESIINKMMS